MAEVDLSMLMETCTKESGRTTRPMAEECTPMSMAQDTKESGLKISNTASELKDGLMEHLTRDNMLKERSMAKVNLHGLIRAPSLVISSIITSTVLVFMNGLMEEFTLATGRTTKWKDTVPSHGLMAESMSDNTWTI